MGLLLNIDTAIDTSSICLSNGQDCIALLSNPSQKDSAAWIQPAIQELLADNGTGFRQLEGVAISNGPGSYTGLRVGMATAKGLCYTLNIPLITISTLKMMTVAVLEEEPALYCPMIDARRMEVFTALYDRELNEVMQSHNLILSGDSFKEALEKERIIFFGNGSVKFEKLIEHHNAFFCHAIISAKHLIPLSDACFKARDFADLALSEPYYGKEFYSPVAKSLL